MIEASSRVLCLDACSVINLAAIREVDSLGVAVGTRLIVVRNVAAESLFLRDESGGDRREAIELSGLEITDLREDELGTYIQLAQDLDDGEAATLSVAHHRDFTVVSDDAQAHKVARRLNPAIDVLGTSAIVRLLASREQLTPTDVGILLRRIEVRARFRPRRQDPDSDWWTQMAHNPC